MQGRLLQIAERLRTGYWLIPGLMCLLAIALAEFAVRADRSRDVRLPLVALLDAAGAEGSRAVLGAIAGSMITVAATVFSITVLTLSLASQQFGPRLLRNFMRDRWNQFTLGTFTSTFLYSLLVLRSAEGGETGFVPRLGVSLGMLMAVGAVGVLIIFIHRVSVQIQAPQVIAMVARELDEQLDEFFPAQIGREPPPGAQPAAGAWEGGAAREICFDASGYVEAIDRSMALAVATRHDAVVKLLVRPGRYVVAGQPCALVHPADRVPERGCARIVSGFVLSSRRTPVQDPEFAVRQLVEIAARALSPGINDPFTAMACVDHLAAALVKLAQRPIPSPCRADRSGVVRVIAEGSTFVEVLRISLEPLRQYGAGHPLVVCRLVDALTLLAEFVRRGEDRVALGQELDRIEAGVRSGLALDPQREFLEERIRAARRVLRGAAAGSPELGGADLG